MREGLSTGRSHVYSLPVIRYRDEGFCRIASSVKD
jgi:hypothetical protein